MSLEDLARLKPEAGLMEDAAPLPSIRQSSATADGRPGKQALLETLSAGAADDSRVLHII